MVRDLFGVDLVNYRGVIFNHLGQIWALTGGVMLQALFSSRPLGPLPAPKEGTSSQGTSSQGHTMGIVRYTELVP